MRPVPVVFRLMAFMLHPSTTKRAQHHKGKVVHSCGVCTAVPLRTHKAVDPPGSGPCKKERVHTVLWQVARARKMERRPSKPLATALFSAWPLLARSSRQPHTGPGLLERGRGTSKVTASMVAHIS